MNRRSFRMTHVLLASTLLMSLARTALAQLPELPPQPAALEGSIRSLNSHTPTSILFSNQTSQTLQVIWLNFTGQRVLYNVLQPGQSYVQLTFLTHPWLIANTRGQGLAIYLPIAQPAEVVLTDASLPPTATDSALLTIVGAGGQATIKTGDCITLQLMIRLQGTGQYVDVTQSVNTTFFTNPARGQFSAKNVWCATAAEANKSITLYGQYRDPVTGITTTATARVLVRP